MYHSNSKYAPSITIEEDDSQDIWCSRSCRNKSLQKMPFQRFWRTAVVIVCVVFFVSYSLPTHPRISVGLETQQQQLSSPSPTDSSVQSSPVVDNRPIPPFVDWSLYAYSQYVTSEEHICQAVMMFESLARLDSKADRIMLYPDNWDVEDQYSATSGLMRKARDEYDVKLIPVRIWSFGEGTWADGFTKFLVFNQTQYKRVLALDSDATLLQNLDELFFLPSTRIALCHGYWYPHLSFSGQLMLVEPSTTELSRILSSLQAERLSEDWDTEVLNRLYWHDALYIPSRPYDLISRDFRNEYADHYGYMGNHDEDWDPDVVFAEAKYIHFSDWPFPKPWVQPTELEIEVNQPRCFEVEGSEEMDCRDRKYWWWLYDDFGERRERICGAKYDRYL